MFFAACCVLLLGILIGLNNTMAQSLVVGRDLFLKMDREPELDPFVVAADSDQFVIAGDSPLAHIGWAMKVDATGKVIWTYTIGLFADDIPAFRGILFSPRISGAVAMPDGTTYLCGSMPRPPTQYSPGLLIHLDAAGQVLGTQFLIPKERNTHGIAHFSSCIKWDDGLALVGQVQHSVREGEDKQPYPKGRVYWAVIIGGDGQIKSETQIRPSVKFAGFDVGPIVRDPNSDASFVFSATDNISTEIVRANTSGTAEVARQLSGRFLLVRPVTSDGLLEIFGAFLSDAQTPTVTMLLDDQLKETSRAEGFLSPNIAARLAYRMPDRSLMLFDSGVEHSGAVYFSRVVHVAPDLRSEGYVDLSRDKIFDGGSIWAAAPTGNLGEFAVATLAAVHRLDAKTPPEPVAGFTRGAVLGFVQIK